MNIQLLHQIRPVSIDGANAEEERLGDLPVCVPLCDKLQNFDFPLRQLLFHTCCGVGLVQLLFLVTIDEPLNNELGDVWAEESFAGER